MEPQLNLFKHPALAKLPTSTAKVWGHLGRKTEPLVAAFHFAFHKMKTPTDGMEVEIQLVAGDDPDPEARSLVAGVLMDPRQARQTSWVVSLANGLSLRIQLEAAIHEAVHVDQLTTGKMETRLESGGVVVSWMGKELGEWTGIPYPERPWEADARNRGKMVLEDFFKFMAKRA